MLGAGYTVMQNHGGGELSVAEGCCLAIATLVAVALIAALIWWILNRLDK